MDPILSRCAVSVWNDAGLGEILSLEMRKLSIKDCLLDIEQTIEFLVSLVPIG